MVAVWDPEWVELAKSMGDPPAIPEERNEETAKVFNDFFVAAANRLPPPPEDVVSRDMQVPDGPKVRVYKPTAASPDGQPVPMILFCHGGGWWCGDLDTEDRTCRIICSSVGAWVVSVEYRQGFHVPLETSVDDCYSAFEWARGRAASHNADPSRMIVMGGSAGGALAAAVVNRLVQNDKSDHVAGLVGMNSLYLHPDATPEKYTHLMTSYVENGGPLPFVSGEDTLDLYKRRKIEPPNTDLNLFPAAGGPDQVRGFPATYIITSDNDASRDDGTVMEAVLADAGVRVKRDNIMGLAHYFWLFPLPKANESFWQKLIDGIKWTLE